MTLYEEDHINMFGWIIAFFSGMAKLFLRVSYTQNFPPPLSSEEEAACFRRMKAGDRHARDMLIEHNMRLVAHIVKKYYTSAQNQEDLISIGTIGLIKAIDSFDPENGARFATYASKCLKIEILMYFRSQKKSAGEVSINETIDIDKDGNPLTYIDIISSEDTIADDIDIKIRSTKAIKIINDVLDERERQIIILRYGLNNRLPVTQREIASSLGISRSYVSRIEKSALEKLRDALGG